MITKLAFCAAYGGFGAIAAKGARDARPTAFENHRFGGFTAGLIATVAEQVFSAAFNRYVPTKGSVYIAQRVLTNAIAFVALCLYVTPAKTGRQE